LIARDSAVRQIGYGVRMALGVKGDKILKLMRNGEGGETATVKKLLGWVVGLSIISDKKQMGGKNR